MSVLLVNKGVFRIMLRKTLIIIKRVRKLKYCLLALVWFALCALTLCWLSAETSAALMLPPPVHDLTHFRRNRQLDHYIENIEVVIEPSPPCPGGDLPVVVMVTSGPSHEEQRLAIRHSWATQLTTYFVLGVDGDNAHDNLVQTDVYIEAKEFGDMIVYNMVEDYQNLTLKTMLMLHWVQRRCSHATFIMKTDDDILINPWILDRVVTENKDAALIGYKFVDKWMHRDEYNKWYVPRWMGTPDTVEEYLTGTGYLINGAYVSRLYEKAQKFDLINLEDVYLTYLVAKVGLKLNLTHDARMSQYKPWLPIDCLYWSHATYHSLTPDEILDGWEVITRLHKQYEVDSELCSVFNKYFYSEWMFY